MNMNRRDFLATAAVATAGAYAAMYTPFYRTGPKAARTFDFLRENDANLI